MIGNTFSEMLKPRRPSCLVKALKELTDSLPKPGASPIWSNAPSWYAPVDTSGDYCAPFRNILLDCIAEIEMHQKLNGELYKKLYG